MEKLFCYNIYFCKKGTLVCKKAVFLQNILFVRKLPSYVKILLLYTYKFS